MKKLFILGIICTSLAISSLGVYAGGNTDIEQNIIYKVLEKIEKDDDKEETLDNLNEGFLKSDSGLDSLKGYIKDGSIGQGTRKKLGITDDDVDNAIDDFKEWNLDSRQKLIDYVKDGDMDKAAELIENDGKEESANSGTGGGGGGGSAIGDEKIVEQEKSEQENTIKHNFEDIKGHWAEQSIAYMNNENIVSGVNENEFNPEGKINRAEVTTLMVKMLKMDINKPHYMEFKDILNEDWYYKYVRAAYANNLISGMSNEEFMPMGKVTREQMLTMAINILSSNDVIINADNITLDQYKDNEQISKWAVDYIKKAKTLDLLRNEEEVNPKEEVSRAEVVWVLEKIYKIIKENRGI